MKCFRERLFASLVKKNLRLTFFICGTCSGVDRLKLPLKVCQKSDFCGVFEMTNVNFRKFFLVLPSNIMKASGAMRVLECSQRNSLSSGLDNCLEFLKCFLQAMQTRKKSFLLLFLAVIFIEGG